MRSLAVGSNMSLQDPACVSPGLERMINSLAGHECMPDLQVAETIWEFP